MMLRSRSGWSARLIRERALTRAVSRAARLGLPALLATAAACSEVVLPTAPAQQSQESLRVESRIDCVGNTRTHVVSCSQSAPSQVTQEEPGTGSRIAVPAAARDIILGNQGGYVRLTSSNVVSASNVFSFDVTVRNLIVQKIGTTNGSTVAPTGIRVFFASGPEVTSGTGAIDFVNPGGGFFYDGRDTFTASNQPYLQYNSVLATGVTSSAKTWRLRFDASVLTFAFTVYVNAPVQFQNGYVSGNPYVLTLNPAQTSTIVGSVRNAVNTVIGGTITFTSTDPSIATVNSSGLVTGGPSRGFTYVTLASGAIPNYVTTAVNVCATTPTIARGSTVNGTIDSADCYSGYANSISQPDPAYLSDMFRISLTAGQQISITLTSDGTYVPFLNLVNPFGEIEQTTFGNMSNTASLPAGPSIQRTGTYIIEAGQNDVFPGTPGNYTLSVAATP